MTAFNAWSAQFVFVFVLQAGIGAMLAATMAVTSPMMPMAYAAPFETGTGLAPTGENCLFCT